MTTGTCDRKTHCVSSCSGRLQADDGCHTNTHRMRKVITVFGNNNQNREHHRVMVLSGKSRGLQLVTQNTPARRVGSLGIPIDRQSPRAGELACKGVHTSSVVGGGPCECCRWHFERLYAHFPLFRTRNLLLCGRCRR